MSDTQKNWCVFGGLLLLFSLVYLPVLQGYYVHHDDYYFWAWNRSRLSSHPIYRFLIYECGRPLAVYTLGILGIITKNLRLANAARFLGVFNLSLLAFAVYLWLRKNAVDMVYSLLLVTIIFTLPTFQSNVATVCNGTNLFAGMAAAYGGLIAFRGAQRWQKKGGGVFNRYTWMALSLLFASLLLNQPSTMFYWVMVAILLLNIRIDQWQEWRNKVFYLFGLNFAAIGGYFIFTKFLPPPSDGSQYALKVTADYSAKLNWFLNEPLVNALNLWKIYPSQKLADTLLALILLAIAAGMGRALINILKTKGENGEKGVLFSSYFQKYFLLICIIPLSFLVNLAAASNMTPYRSLIALSPMVAVLLFWALSRLGAFLPARAGRVFVTAVLVIGCLVGIYSAHYNLMNYYAFSQTLDLRYIKSAVRQHDLSRFERIHIIRHDPLYEFSFVAPRSRYDEFATSASGFWQDIPWVVRCALNESGRGEFFDKLKISSSTREEYQGFPEETLLIDMNRLNYFY